MSRPKITLVTRTQGNNAAIKTGAVGVRGFELDLVEVPVIIDAFRRMVRGLEFDVCEMALTTYLCAREHGIRFTALPIFLVRAFHHGAILHDCRSPVTDPSRIEGRRVGVGRGYTVTTGVWARSILQEEYGVDLSAVTWVLSGDEHVEGYRPPANVERIRAGSSLEAQLLSGELAAVINVMARNPAIVPMIPQAFEAGLAAYRERGHYPINHCVVVRNDVLRAHPSVGRALFEAFAEAKRRYVSELRRCSTDRLETSDVLYRRLLDMGEEPLPYGIAPNRRVLATLVEHALTQRILTRPVAIETLFDPATHDLVG
ncbi:MAG TPA: ABC transporter substrate-binding protein [Gammaproteobacteria bacterium]|nr:ABC transporter substrate-binding protein [Gammaproteobacteria bacterium]